ncbi:DNA polymerase III subunit delta [Rubritalea marina]|uniref:DNA polymerase III subunit delta n=1 Tax=Rubritalea marina TaxID=361055 RepID=UPI000360D93A|nr:DNA polymerase III subunit delta [Rubritalea marina]
MPADNIIVFCGTDEGACAEASSKKFNSLKPDNGDDFADEVIHGDATDSADANRICHEVVQALNTLPFFGGSKTVWLKGANFMGSDRTGDAEQSKLGVEALKACLEQGFDSTVTFILSATSIDKRRAFYKWLKENASIVEHNKLDTSKEGWEEQVALMVQKLSDPLGLVFERDALELFIMLAGEDTRQLNGELNKLDLYLGTERRTVVLSDIQKMVPLSRAGIVFEVGQALQKRDGARALELIDQQLERGESAIAILRASLIPTIRNLFMAKAAGEQTSLPSNNYNSFNAALDRLPDLEKAWLPQKKAGGVNAYPLFLASRFARNFTFPSLKQAMESCLNTDKSLVTTSLDHRMLLHRLVVELVSSPIPRRG